MIKVNHQYELLYSELSSLNIEEYLTSRNFKKMLLEHGATEVWDSANKEAESQINYIVAPDFEREKNQSLNALKILFNYIHLDQMKSLVEDIILDFIKFFNVKKDFSELIQAMRLSGLGSLCVIDSLQLAKENAKLPVEMISTSSTRIIKSKNISKPEKSEKKDISEQTKRIFIVHGHDRGMLAETARLLENQKLYPIILKDEPHKGLTIIEKFVANSSTDFAVVLLSPDDKGCKKTDRKTKPRARQNVIFELGYFYGKLGRERVSWIISEDIEIPTDLIGAGYIQYDSEGWKYKLIEELKAAGFEVSKELVK